MRYFIASILMLSLTACGGGGGGAPAATPIPTVTFNATAQLDGSTSLVYSSTNANNCTINGQSAGVNGSQSILPSVTSVQSYSFACNGDGGSASTSDTAKAPNSFPNNCSPTTTADTAFWVGNYVVHNDQEGNTTHDASYGLGPQCQSATVASDGSIDIITKWDYDPSAGVKAAPGLDYGATSPVAGFGQSTVANYPKKVSSVTNMTITYSDNLTNVSPDTALDLLFDFYFSDTSDLKNETLELGVDTVCINVCNATMTDVVTIDGVTYNVSYQPSITLSSNGAHPKLFFFCTINCTSLQSNGSIVAAHFIQYATSKGYLSTNDYFGNVTAQNEVYAGSATSELNVNITE